MNATDNNNDARNGATETIRTIEAGRRARPGDLRDLVAMGLATEGYDSCKTFTLTEAGREILSGIRRENR